ncbi:ornithine cyclodeaminase [Thermocatellispora tengchongensis]|uniref:Ornithine cyclodeaminase n=1 Tax=Thermocatellispora tengchongensis TaxID=1073253 RepID=A0A840P2K5_9ACTN|nr:2,3-diaminopropionate biosynthesis protein SbnB [Thermocatellispora tengchongensis]MBB5135514.1 ornithine cyclodeaminase [Thermocatellispora tengchongensis]
MEFTMVPGPVVHEILRQNRAPVIDLVRRTYEQHKAGETINPNSYFLRFPDKPDARIIALPAFLGGDTQLAGIKWISSFPANTAAGLPRASAVLILNDYRTGYPVACLEAATISSARTAASAAVAATALRPAGYEGTTVSVIGAGVIARNVCDYLHAAGVRPDGYLVHDLHEESGDALVGHLRRELGADASFTPDLDAALAAGTVVFTTTASVPYVHTPFKPGQVVLNISLRDISPEVICESANILDDVDHCLNANTSPHLAEQATGNRDFITGTLADVLDGTVALGGDRPVIFSPFGLGVLDIAVGAYALEQARQAGTAVAVPGFFAETRRW